MADLIDDVQSRWRVARGAVGAGAFVVIRTPATGKAIQLRSIHVTALAATVLTVRFNPSDIVMEIDIPATQSYRFYFPGRGVKGATNAALEIGTSAATTISAAAFGHEV